MLQPIRGRGAPASNQIGESVSARLWRRFTRATRPTSSGEMCRIVLTSGTGRAVTLRPAHRRARVWS